ncbi:hypothetical protein M2408_004993 [Sphingobacterium sp. BIGb0165]|nr:hypothetical protein [Sphingobacterium sp. BIGb0165]
MFIDFDIVKLKTVLGLKIQFVYHSKITSISI